MTSKTGTLPHERRKGEATLSDFAEYVEKQQALRYPSKAAAAATAGTSAAAAGAAGGAAAQDQHADLDAILDSLDLNDDAAPRVSMRELLLGGAGAGNGAGAGAGDANKGKSNDDGDDDEPFKKLVGLLQERLDEGRGEFVFDLGFESGGDSMGLSRAEWDAALDRLTRAAHAACADCQVLLTRNVGGDAEAESLVAAAAAAAGHAQSRSNKDRDCTGKIMIRRHPDNAQNVIETRIAVVGNVDAGKSSMLGVLVKGDLDDGRGKARVNLFRHKHEIETGRTSSVGMEIMGFDTKGQVVTSDTPGRKLSWEEIGKRSAKVITFTDLAGHERYLRTTVFGLLSSSPNYCLLMVAANNGLIGMSKEHLGIALALNVPVMVVITKIDICPPHILEQTVTQITRTLKSPGARKIPIFIKSREECIATATQFGSQRLCPIFQVSNVTGENLDLVRTFLNILPHYGRYDSDAPFEFHINDTFSVPFVGTVVSGIVKSGVVHAGDPVWVGPDSNGNFTATSVRSIERKRIGVPAASAGQSASFALKKMRRKDVRKGQVVLLKTEEMPKVYREFVAEVLILAHATTIKTKYQAMLHVGPVSQTCAIIDVDRPFIRTGDRATVAFRFVQRPEYLAKGDRLLFREGRTKGLGIVQSVGYDASKPLMPRGAGAGEGASGEGAAAATAAGGEAGAAAAAGKQVEVGA